MDLNIWFTAKCQSKIVVPTFVKLCNLMYPGFGNIPKGTFQEPTENLMAAFKILTLTYLVLTCVVLSLNT